ncbi:MAG: arylsulfatase [bacterium]|nr:arylsulfatase [bacterium]
MIALGITRGIVLSALTCASTWAADDPELPNVVLILADDMGLASSHAMHPASGLATPALDRLAAEGMAFTDTHSGSAVCSPTRYGLLTGRYAWRTRMKSGIVGKWQPPLIADERTTLPELLAARGYRTDCIGKWHLGWHWPDAQGGRTKKPTEIDYTRPIEGGPLAHGFEHYFGDDVPNWPPYVWIEDERALAVPKDTMQADPANGVSPGPMTPGWSLEAVLPELTERCVSRIAKHAAADEPFFLFFSMTSPHTPISPAERFRGKSGAGAYADFLLETDWAVGRVLEALKEHGVADETLVIFTADNGTSPKCKFDALAAHDIDLRAGWRGHKADIWEGGHRVPFFVRWPGVVRAGARCAEPIVLTDVMATVAEAVGAELGPRDAVDGTSLVPWLREVDELPPHPPIVHHSSTGQFAIRAGRWKLAFCPGSGGWSAPKGAAARELGLLDRQLYDMPKDPSEKVNLARKQPERVLALTEELKALVSRGRSTPGPEIAGAERAWWAKLPWEKPE